MKWMVWTFLCIISGFKRVRQLWKWVSVGKMIWKFLVTKSVTNTDRVINLRHQHRTVICKLYGPVRNNTLLKLKVKAFTKLYSLPETLAKSIRSWSSSRKYTVCESIRTKTLWTVNIDKYLGVSFIRWWHEQIVLKNFHHLNYFFSRILSLPIMVKNSWHSLFLSSPVIISQFFSFILICSVCKTVPLRGYAWATYEVEFRCWI